MTNLWLEIIGIDTYNHPGNNHREQIRLVQEQLVTRLGYNSSTTEDKKDRPLTNTIHKLKT